MKLDGIRQKVFLDRYALKDKTGAPLEKTPEEMWRRVSKAVAKVEKKDKQKSWEETFYEAMEDFKFVPGGRVLAGAGTGFDVTFYNCLPGDQEILTPQGYKPIKNIKVGDIVITGKKRGRKVKNVFVRKTKEPLYIIKPTKLGFDDVRLTGEHPILAIKEEWVNTHRSRDGLRLKEEPKFIKAANLKKGDFIAVGWDAEVKLKSEIKIQDYLSKKFVSENGYLTKSQLRKPIKDTIKIDKDFMLLAGTWLGDGCVTHRTGTDIPAGIQITFNSAQKKWAEEIAYILQEKYSVVPTVREDRWGQKLIQVRVESYPVGLFFKNFFGAYSYKKKIPQVLTEQPLELILPLIKGLFRSDGYLTNDVLGIAVSNKTLATQIHQLILRTNRFFTIFENNAKNGRHDTYRVNGGISQANGLCEYIFGEKRSNNHHDQDYYLEYDNSFWVRINSIKTQAYEDEVYDIEVEEDHSFITAGIVVSNCFVLPSPQDSRDGILDNLKAMIEIMARGGGTGINISSLRPRGSRVKKVNGFSSGPCNWAEMYSLATKDIIQQGGCFAPDARIMTHRGLITISEIVEGKNNYFAATHKGYKKITAKFNNGLKDIYEVTTTAGLKVKVTNEHKFLTFNENGEFYLKRLSNFKEGEDLVLLLGEWSNDLPYVSLDNTLPLASKYSYGLKDIILPKELNEDLAFILGTYDSDGSKIPDEYSKNGKGIRIAVADDRSQDLKTLISALKRCFGVTPTTRKGDGAVTIVQVFSRKVNEFLKLNNLLKEFSINVRVPEQIFTSPKNVVAAYIAGVFMGDGSNRGGKGGLRITTVSENFAQDLQLLLLNLGIPSKIKLQERQEKNWRTLYTVTVNGATFMQKFLRLLAPYTEKVLDHKPSIRNGFFGWPFNMVERFLYLSNYQRACARTNPTTSQKSVMFLQQIVPNLKEVDRSDVEFLGGCIPDKISAINYIGKENVYDLEVEEVHLLSGNGFYTSNSRRGALMLMLWDWHPDVEEFITVKQDLSRINGANLSVCISDKFMEAVKEDKDWDLVFPDITDPEYDEKWDGVLDHWKKLGKKVVVHKTVKAKQIWDLICQAAWRSAEPGLVFMERYNKWYNNWYWNTVNCVNPCGEEGLPAWGVCNLASLNLSAFVKGYSVDNPGKMDYKNLYKYAKIAVRFQDDVVDADKYFFKEIEERQLRGERRIGLGTLGLADALIKMHLRYGSEESLKEVDKIFKTIRDAAYEASVEIAKEKGAFPKIDIKKHIKGYFIKKLPKKTLDLMKKQGVRNSMILQEAPTGTTSLLSGASSGIEPVYEFEFIRRSKLGEHIMYHPLYEEWKKTHADDKKPDYFVSANDLTPEDHVKVQATIQQYVDASISKTVNAPKTHTVEDVKKLYMLAYDSGCKGITYMRDGSREGVLARMDDKKKEEVKQDKPAVVDKPVTPRPMQLEGVTYQIDTPVGKTYITINHDAKMEPFEVFITIGKSGSDVAAMADALGRMISVALRLNGALSPRERIRQIISQLAGIGGARTVGFGKEKIRSLPDGVAKVLSRHFDFTVNGHVEDKKEAVNGNGHKEVASGLSLNGNGVKAQSEIVAIQQLAIDGGHQAVVSADVSTTNLFDLCPECGAGSLAYEEGCQKCYSCGYSAC